MKTMKMWSRLSVLALVLVLLAPAAASAQSLFSTRGLGYILQPTDARARGLGGVGLAMEGAELGWINPADVAGLPAPGLRFTYQQDEFDASFDGREAEGSTARFPMLLAAMPIGSRAAISVGVAGFLDQNWAVEERDTVFANGDTTFVLDRFTSEGGVSQVRVGGAYRVLDRLSVGAAFDYYIGDVRRVGGRIFPDDIGGPRCCSASWRYSGFGGSVGAEWSPLEAMTIAGAATFGGTLDAETSDSLAVDRSYSLPTRISLGASGRVANSLLLALSGEWGGWSGLNSALAEEGGARDVTSLHGGVEWDGANLFNRPLAIRLGARRTELPFSWGTAGQPTDWADESAISGGLGIVLGNGAVRADIATERGNRGGDAAGIDESFWRTSISVTVLGR